MRFNLREVLAAYAHEAWAAWMRYLFGFGKWNSDGSFTIVAEKAQRWQRQSSTKYSDLPENEKPSDRDEADKILAIFDREARE